MSTYKVVLIEDDPDIVSLYTMRFGLSKELEVTVANDGAAGLEAITLVQPDIILLDMMMPTMSGVETLERLRKFPHGDRYKVIALTNMKDEDTVNKIHALGVEEYLVKVEHSPGDIVKTIFKVLGHPESKAA